MYLDPITGRYIRFDSGRPQQEALPFSGTGLPPGLPYGDVEKPRIKTRIYHFKDGGKVIVSPLGATDIEIIKED